MKILPYLIQLTKKRANLEKKWNKSRHSRLRHLSESGVGGRGVAASCSCTVVQELNTGEGLDFNQPHPYKFSATTLKAS